MVSQHELFNVFQKESIAPFREKVEVKGFALTYIIRAVVATRVDTVTSIVNFPTVDMYSYKNMIPLVAADTTGA